MQRDLDEEYQRINPRFMGEKDVQREALMHINGPKFFQKKNLDHFAKKLKDQQSVITEKTEYEQAS